MKPIIPQEEYQRMKYDPTVKGDIIKKYPELSPIFEGVSDKEARWIITLFSEDSPIHERETKFTIAHRMAADEVGIKIPDDIYTRSEILDSIHKYLIFIDNELWEMIISTTIAFREYQRLIRIPLDSKELDKKTLDAATVKTKLINDSHDLRLKIKGYRKELYGSDDLDERQKKRQKISPESVQGI